MNIIKTINDKENKDSESKAFLNVISTNYKNNPRQNAVIDYDETTATMGPVLYKNTPPSKVGYITMKSEQVNKIYKMRHRLKAKIDAKKNKN